MILNTYWIILGNILFVMCPFQPFSNPSESHCEPVYTEEALRSPTPTPATGCNPLLNPSSDLKEEPTEPAISLMLDVQNEMPVDPVEAPHQSSPGESRALLSSESSLLNPYQSQSCVETPALRTNKQCKHLLPVKHQEKTLPVPVYVTLDMFEQGQVRWEKLKQMFCAHPIIYYTALT